MSNLSGLVDISRSICYNNPFSLKFMFNIGKAVLLPCLCWCIFTFLGALPPPTIDQWNSVKLPAGMCYQSPMCLWLMCVLVHINDIQTKQESAHKKHCTIALPMVKHLFYQNILGKSIKYTCSLSFIYSEFYRDQERFCRRDLRTDYITIKWFVHITFTKQSSHTLIKAVTNIMKNISQ